MAKTVTIAVAPETVGAQMISLDTILSSPLRAGIDDDDVGALATSIVSLGLLCPIVVRGSAEHPGFYEVVAGRCRVEAFDKLGLESIPALVRDDLDDRTAEMAEISENLHRAELQGHDRDKAAARWAALFREGHADFAEPCSAKSGGKKARGEAIRSVAATAGVTERQARKLVARGEAFDDDDRATLEAAGISPYAALAAARIADPAERKAAVRALAESAAEHEDGPPAELAESDATDLKTYLRACPIREHVKDVDAHDADASAYLTLYESGALAALRSAVAPLVRERKGKPLGPFLSALRRAAEAKAPADWRISEDNRSGYSIA